MAQSINLIPQEEKKEQRKEKIVKLSSVLSVLLLVIVIGVCAFYWYQKKLINDDIVKVENAVESRRNDIKALSEMELKARTLDQKFRVLDEFYDNSRRYSVLLSEIQKRVPANTVTVETFSIAGENKQMLSISGKGLDYISIAKYIDTLSDKEFENAAEGFEDLILNVTLNSVTLDNQDLSVTYFIVIEYDPNLLR